MSISPNTQAILLLTSHFSKAKNGSVKPLTPKEWGRFALWLKDKSLTDLDNLPEPDVLAEEIIENIEAGLNSFRDVLGALNTVTE